MQPANCQKTGHLDFKKAVPQVSCVTLGRLALLLLPFFFALPAYAQQGGASPWENAVNVLKTAFTGTIATGLSLVAIVVGGLMFAYGEGQSKRMLAGIVFGVGMAIGAVNFMAWLFPG
jgi:type IV secretory pathway VirB2 component (pilin)